MSIPDKLLWNYYELLTDVPASEIAAKKSAIESGRVNPRDVKADLARNVTAQFHGEEAAARAEEDFRRAFSRGELPEEIEATELSPEEPSAARVLVAAGLAASMREARRKIAEGALPSTRTGQPRTVKDAGRAPRHVTGGDPAARAALPPHRLEDVTAGGWSAKASAKTRPTTAWIHPVAFARRLRREDLHEVAREDDGRPIPNEEQAGARPSLLPAPDRASACPRKSKPDREDRDRRGEDVRGEHRRLPGMAERANPDRDSERKYFMTP